MRYDLKELLNNYTLYNKSTDMLYWTTCLYTCISLKSFYLGRQSFVFSHLWYKRYRYSSGRVLTNTCFQLNCFCLSAEWFGMTIINLILYHRSMTEIQRHVNSAILCAFSLVTDGNNPPLASSYNCLLGMYPHRLSDNAVWIQLCVLIFTWCLR